MATHQPLERGLLVLGVVVDVQVGPPLEPRDDEVDHRFERDLLLRVVVAPEGVEHRRAALVDLDDAEEVLEPLVTDERVALEVEEQVAGGRLGQEAQPAVGLRLEQFVGALPGATLDDLEPRLLAEPLGRGRSHAARPDVRRSVGEFLDRRDAGVGELAGLVAPHPGDEAQVVVVAPAAVAHVRPAAQRAVADRVGVGLGVRGERRLELGLHRAVVGGELPQREGPSLHGAEPDVDVIRWVSLDPGDVLGVRGELEQRGGLNLPGELRVLDLVAPRPEVARSVGFTRKSANPIHRPSKNVAWKMTSTPACIASTVRRSSSASSAALTFSSPRSISTTSSPRPFRSAR